MRRSSERNNDEMSALKSGAASSISHTSSVSDRISGSELSGPTLCVKNVEIRFRSFTSFSPEDVQLAASVILPAVLSVKQLSTSHESTDFNKKDKILQLSY